MELRACPLCQHHAAEIIQQGTVNKYKDGHFDHFHCKSYYISCQACGYSVHKDSLTDAKLSWNMDKPTVDDLRWYIDQGDALVQRWEQEQMWLPKDN